MFRKLLAKLIGKKAAPIADMIVTEALDRVTDGKASKVERAIERRKRR